jgi:hypothetical protein
VRMEVMEKKKGRAAKALPLDCFAGVERRIG